ncbi:MAG: glycosyltransferase family 4 protein [Myxococcota bacterium]
MVEKPLRIALLTYRGNPRSGGQGVYVRLLGRALQELGHRVDVWSGPPYPELTRGVRLVRVPSLELWEGAPPFRWPSLQELSDPINLAEFTRTRFGEFPEPLTFSQRVAREFARTRPRYDVVHDNQCLGPGLLALRQQVPVVATVHHPITFDRRHAMDASRNWLRRMGVRRFYSFVPTQIQVARRLSRILTVSECSKRDIVDEFGVPPERLRVIFNGVDVALFRSLPDVPRRNDLVVSTLSADQPLKGFRYLLEAFARLRRARPGLRLRVVGSPGERTDTRRRLRRLGLEQAVEFTGRVPAEDIVRMYAEATVAVVPSLYEGFGFPAAEAMACEVPVVSTRGGALPEVVGEGGETGLLVAPGDAEALADAVGQLLDDPARRARVGKAGRDRVLRHFTWKAAAERTVAAYHEAIAEHARRRAAPGAAAGRRRVAC